MKLLLLGGTSDARQLAGGLLRQGVEVIYSIAGLVRQPKLDCRVVSGGFSAQGGLARFVVSEAIDAIADATHPYAQRMSQTAAEVSGQQGIPLWRYQRPPWQARPGDDWCEFEDWAHLPPLLRDKKSVFITAGQAAAGFVAQLPAQAGEGRQTYFLRSANRPETTLPDSFTWIQDIGPFDIDSERELFERYQIDALVAKNSGGTAAAAKLNVARERAVPVFLLRRPILAAADVEFSDLQQCLDFVAGRTLGTA